jgi:hypothetical protein
MIEFLRSKESITKWNACNGTTRTTHPIRTQIPQLLETGGKIPRKNANTKQRPVENFPEHTYAAPTGTVSGKANAPPLTENSHSNGYRK